MQYSVGKFLVALTLGRIVRYSLLAFLAAHYGRQMLTTVMSQLGHPVLVAIYWADCSGDRCSHFHPVNSCNWLSWVKETP
jgi:hypothetical protein